MADFNSAIAVVLKHEGGYVNNPADRGGPTNMGVTQPTLNDYLTKEELLLFPVEKLQKDTAADIYEELFWKPLGLIALTSTALATVCLDLAVMKGLHGFTQLLQSVLGVSIDGCMGPETAISLQRADAADPKLLAQTLINHQARIFHSIVVANPSQAQFLPGWLNRMNDLQELL